MVDTVTKLGKRVPVTTQGDLTLQICGSSREGQIVQLKSHKCSIGSGEHCTLRVRDRSVKPLHCVIFRGQAETFVRSWAHDTRLNGRSFSDAKLSAGDRIAVGSIEFEVLDPTGRQLRMGQDPGSRQTTPAAKPKSAAAQPIVQQQASEEQHRQWEIARKEAEQQLGKRAQELDEQMALLEELEADLHRKQEEWEASRAEAQEQLAARAAIVDKREAELDIRLAELRNRPAAADLTSADSDSANSVSQDDALPTDDASEKNEQTENTSADEESVEQYMERLLGRVRPTAGGADADAKAETLES